MNQNDTNAQIVEHLQQLPGRQWFPTLVDYLADRRATKRSFAGEIFTKLGSSALSSLIREAVLRRRCPRQCAAILDVIAKIGGPLTPDDWMNLPILLASGHASVREKAARLMIALRQSHNTPAMPTPATAAVALTSASTTACTTSDSGSSKDTLGSTYGGQVQQVPRANPDAGSFTVPPP